MPNKPCQFECRTGGMNPHGTRAAPRDTAGGNGGPIHKREIILTEDDLRRLKGLVDRSTSLRDREYIRELGEELSRATVMPASEIPADVITMESTVMLRDRATGEETASTLVSGDSDSERRRISILAPAEPARFP